MNDFVQVLKYARTLYQRSMLALASTMYAVFTLFAPNLETYQYVGNLPHNLVLPEHYKLVVAAVFGLNAVMSWWRIFDDKARVAWGTITNIMTAFLWLTVTMVSILVYAQPWSANVGEIMLTLTAFYTITRTDYTSADRGSA